MLGVTDYEAPWNRSDYPELELSEVPAKGEGSVKMTLSPYALDDVCVWLLADDAYSDCGKIYCTRMYIGLTVSGVEQDITEAPQTLAAPDGTFEFDPANPQEQAGYTSMPQTYYGINGFSADSAAGCEYYTIGRRGEQDGSISARWVTPMSAACSLRAQDSRSRRSSSPGSTLSRHARRW